MNMCENRGGDGEMRKAIVIPLLLLIGCTESVKQDNDFGYLRAINDAYLCAANKAQGDTVSKFDNPVPFGKMIRSLADGLYWLEGVDEHGENTIDSVLIGKSGWMHDGIGRNRLTRCVLSDTTNNVLIGKCRNWERVVCYSGGSIDPYTGEDEKGVECACKPIVCEFLFPIDVSKAELDLSSLRCINASAEDSSSVSVTMNDSIVEIKVLDSKVTWTKRSGL